MSVAMAGQAYMRQLQAHPLRTKAITSGVLAGCSDAVARRSPESPGSNSGGSSSSSSSSSSPSSSSFYKKDSFFQGCSSVLGFTWRPFGQVKSKVKKDYASVQLTAWKFWPIVSWINYEYMPLQLRVLFHSFVASCWAVFLNLKAARSIANTKKA
nr:unnamed protein product [Digitaria exilis]